MLCKKVLTIDFDVVMQPSINEYNKLICTKSQKILWRDIDRETKILSTVSYSKEILDKLYAVVDNLNYDKLKLAHASINHNIVLKGLLDKKDVKYDVFSIDHHHDIFYSDKDLLDAKNGVSSQGNWVAFLKERKLLNKFVWVKNVNSEIEKAHKKYINKSMVTVDILELDLEDVKDIDIFHLSFSSQWIPPTFNPLFYDFKSHLESKYGRVLELNYGDMTV